MARLVHTSGNLSTDTNKPVHSATNSTNGRGPPRGRATCIPASARSTRGAESAPSARARVCLHNSQLRPCLRVIRFSYGTHTGLLDPRRGAGHVLWASDLVDA